MALPLLVRGENMSLTERAASTLSGSQTADPLFPYSRLGDTRPSQLFIFPTRATDEYFLINTNQYLNGDFENWTLGVPNDHTVNVTGTGAVTEETTSPIFTGGSSMQLENGASGTVEVLQTISVLAGEQVELRYASQTSSAGSPATLEVFNPYTGKWLTSAGAWSSRRQNAVEDAATSMADTTLAFTVEAFSAVRNHEVGLEIRYHMDQAAASVTHHWDAVRWIPAVDFTSIHAHNMSAGISPRLVSSDSDIGIFDVDRAVGFDGATQVDRASDFTGLVDGRQGTLSVWFRMDGGDGTNQVILANGDNITRRFQLRRLAANTVELEAFDSGGTSRLTITSTGTITADGNLHHALLSWDLDGVADDQLLILDGVRDDTPVFAAADIDYTTAEWSIGGYSNATADLNGTVGEVWFDPTANIDFKLAANVALFRTTAGKAALLGANGELVNGTSPILYWPGDFTSPLVNLGTGGDFDSVVGGPLTDEVRLEAELTKQDVAFYARLSTKRVRQFWKFHMRGLNAVNPIEVGQWIIGEAIEPPWSPRLQDNQETKIFSQTNAVVEASGEEWRIKKAKHPRRQARMRFRLKSTTEQNFKEELLARTSQGADPIVLVEDQSASKVVHGRIPNESEFRRRAIRHELTELIVEESSNGIGLP